MSRSVTSTSPIDSPVSGVHRGMQRRIYDRRRDDLIPAHELTLLVVRPAELTSDNRGRLKRDR